MPKTFYTEVIDEQLTYIKKVGQVNTGSFDFIHFLQRNSAIALKIIFVFFKKLHTFLAFNKIMFA